MRTKKAIVLPETLKIIIGVLCIVILVYLAFSLYSIFITKSKLAQARETLKQIVDEVNGLEEGEKTDYLVTSPKDWRFINYEKKLCICPCFIDSDKQEGICLKQGVCEDIRFNIKMNNFCILDCSLDKVESCISFKNLPKSIFFWMENGNYFIGTEKDLILRDNLKKIVEENKELLSGYLSSTDEKQKTEIQEKIRKNLTIFYSTFDSKALFGINEDQFVWKFEIIKDGKTVMEIKEEATGIEFLSGISETKEASFKLSYHNPSRDPTGGYGGGI